MSVFGVRQRQIEDVYAAIAFGRLTFVLRQRDCCCRVIFPLSAVCYRILVVCVSPGDLSGDAPKILKSGTRTVCRVRDEFSLGIFCRCFLLGIFQAARPRSSGRELVPCAAFAMNFRFGFFECVSPGICEAVRSNPQVRNSYRVCRRVYAPKIPVFVSVNKFRTPLGVCRPIAIEYQTPLRISGTCFPRTAGNIEHEACHEIAIALEIPGSPRCRAKHVCRAIRH